MNGVTLEIPANWRLFKKSTHALAGPTGGVIRGTDGNAGTVTYGLMADVYRPEKNANEDSAITSLLHELTSGSSSVKVGQQREAKVAGVDIQMVECTNPQGRGDRSERFWIAALPESNGGMRYLAFVAPAADFKQMRPTFHHILRSLTVQF